ncbi:MAG: VWA domain-containing protein [Planctomycetes bacterium]|nr:VWA domain-containing protein [Planctomycetota bacterium]MCB9886558.1 VWA domain-containing protein [Planctomycetota bacterium]
MNDLARALCLAAAAASPLSLAAQQPYQWVVPSRAVIAPAGATAVQIVRAEARVRILDRAASTELEFELHNPSTAQQEAVLLLPIPDGAAISEFAFDGAAAEPTAKILPREEARRLYDEITRKLRDPALLEFADWRCLRSSVFPVPAGGRQKIRLRYDHVCDTDGNRVDYVLPRSEMLTSAVPWSISVGVRSPHQIRLVYSPSHELVERIVSPNERTVRVSDAGRHEPGSFRLGFVTSEDPSKPSASLFAYPDPTIGGGYFLLLAGAPQVAAAHPLRREVTIALDRSGSMAGRKLEQAKAAALQVIEGLADGEGLQLIDYGNSVGSCFAAPVAKSDATMQQARQWLQNVRPHGGTNLHDALLEALRAPALPETLPLVLFLTDGIPTVGPTRETDLRALVDKGNPHGRRVFCFGVGNDVNAPLLDHIAEKTRAVTTYVLPDEDVETRVAGLFARLGQPTLAGPALTTVDDQGKDVARLAEVLPIRLPDLFAGDQLVVLGQYRGDDDLQFRLTGQGPEGARSFRFTLPVRSASTRHAFVPRLWASRQIAFLVDELRQRGGDLGAPLTYGRPDPFSDPKLRELRDEILRLSTRFGVLSEYTSFLATEGSNLGDWGSLVTSCQAFLQNRAVDVRSGAGAVNQGTNLWAQKGQTRANYFNGYLDQNLNLVQTVAVQQVRDCAFYKRGDRWIDSRSVLGKRVEPDEQVQFGSPRYLEVQLALQREGRAAVLSLQGEVLLQLDGRNVLVTAPR